MINPMDLTNKTILVTGASSGLGRQISIHISRLGGKVVLVGRNTAALEETLNRMDGSGHRMEPFDLNEIDAIPKWVKGFSKETGELHGLVHSAGVVSTLSIGVLNLKRINQLMNINFNAAVALTRAFRQKGVAAQSGSIVYLASVYGFIGQTGQSIYSASKGALISMCRSIAMELAKQKIRVNCVAPGHILTEMGEDQRRLLPEDKFKAIEEGHPLGFGEPDDVSNAVAFLLADSGKWITGTTMVVDGGAIAH